jgi:putative endonuclease
MPYSVYVLQNSTGQLYVGSTGEIERRLQEHQRGLARWTASRGPWQLVHREEFSTRSEAMKRERQLKAGQGRQWLRSTLNGRASPPQAEALSREPILCMPYSVYVLRSPTAKDADRHVHLIDLVTGQGMQPFMTCM